MSRSTSPLWHVSSPPLLLARPSSSQTFSTVGYGDITPQTDLGKIVIVLGVLSVIFLILPFAIGRISKRVKDIRIQVPLIAPFSVPLTPLQMSVFPGENHLILWCPDAFCGDFIEEYFMRVRMRVPYAVN